MYNIKNTVIYFFLHSSSSVGRENNNNTTQWEKLPKKQPAGVFFVIRHLKYSAMLSKIHS